MQRLLSQFWITIYVFGIREALARSLHYAGLRTLGVKNYQKPLTKAIKQLSINNKTFIDVGAAGGDIVEEVSPYYKKTIAIEPAPHHINELKSKISADRLKNTILIEHAVGDSDGYAELGMSSTNPDDNSLFMRGDIYNYVKVKKETLDGIVSRLNLSDGIVIKIDVQGFEGFVLNGAKKTMKEGCVIIMEFWPWGIKQAGTNPNKLIESIKNCGYEILTVNGKKYSPKQINKIIEYGVDNNLVVDDIMLVQK